MKIEIFGPGCSRCQKTTEEVEKVARQLGVDAAIEHVTDLDSMVNRGVMFTPAIFIDGVKKVEGRVPKPSEIEKWLKK